MTLNDDEVVSNFEATSKFLDCDRLRENDLLKARVGRLNDRHLYILYLIYAHSFLTKKQISKILEKSYKTGPSSERISSRILNSLLKYKFIYKVKFPHLHFNLYNISKRGIELLRDYGVISANSKYQSIEEAFINHELLVSDIRIKIDDPYQYVSWTTSRELKSLVHEDSKIPDLMMSYKSKKLGREMKVAFEVELTQKSKKRYEKIFFDYSRSDYDLIIYIANRESLRASLIKRANHVSKKIYSTTVEEFLSLVGNTQIKSVNDEFKFKLLTEDNHYMNQN